MFKPEIKQLINYFSDKPMTKEEWFALTQKWESEMSYEAAAIFLGISKNWICRISGPNVHKLERTRKGHVSTKSVYKYRDELQKECYNAG